MLWVIVGLVAVTAIGAILGYNRLVTLRNDVRNLWRQIDVQLKRRYDLIPNLVQAVKGVMSFEQETLEKVIQARNRASSAAAPGEKAAADSELSKALMGLYAVVERYPEIKSHENVRQLQGELTTTENAVASVRAAYNNAVRDYNNQREVVPSNIIAGFFRFEPAEYFEAAEEDRKVPQVSLR